MNKYRIHGALRSTGEDHSLDLDAPDAATASSMATDRGLLVSSIEILSNHASETPQSFSDPLKDPPHIPTSFPPKLWPHESPQPGTSDPVPVVSTTSSDHDILHAIHAEAVKTRKAAVTCATVLTFWLLLFFLYFILVFFGLAR
jgi:hypothetical protein